MEYKTLNNGLKMPMVGLGVYNIPEKETQRVVEDALSVGYRSIDTAAMYENEKGVGDAVRACNVPREGLFKAIGVSNFYPNTFPMIVKDTMIMPVVNQCEAHVLYQQRKMREYLKPYDVALEAWSPLAEGRSSIFKDKTLVGIGEKYGKTSAQIALKFLVQNDIIIIPKTTHKERMVENISLFDFTLTDDDLAAIRRLDTGRNVTGWPSDALRYEPASVDWPSAVNYFVLT